MGSLLSRIVRETRIFSGGWKRRGSVASQRDRSADGRRPEDFTSDECERFDDGVRERRDASSGRVAFPRSRAEVVPDLTVLTRDFEGAVGLNVVSRKVQDATRMVRLDLAYGRKNYEWAEKIPSHDALLEETVKKDVKLSSLDFELELAEKKLSGFQVTTAEKPKKVHLGPFEPLTDVEECEVSLALRDPDEFSHWSDVLVVHMESNIEITRGVMQCLRRGGWLNDEIINLYLELLKERERRQPEQFLKCHFFNTFFYKKLTNGDDGYDFRAVRRWTAQKKLGYGLAECDKIFVPIHKEAHWCLGIIDVNDTSFQYLDSLGGMDDNVLRALARYWVDEIQDKSSRIIDVSSWKHESAIDLPLQQNGWDCGMFMLKYADFYSRGLSLCFGQVTATLLSYFLIKSRASFFVVTEAILFACHYCY